MEYNTLSDFRKVYDNCTYSPEKWIQYAKIARLQYYVEYEKFFELAKTALTALEFEQKVKDPEKYKMFSTSEYKKEMKTPEGKEYTATFTVNWHGEIITHWEAVNRALQKAADTLLPSKPQQLTIPDAVLQALEKTTNKIGNNAVKQMIKNAADRPLKWLVTKQDLREILTDSKIKGDLSVAEVERQTPNLFIDKDGNPMKLAKNKANNSFETDFIKQILATL